MAGARAPACAIAHDTASTSVRSGGRVVATGQCASEYEQRVATRATCAVGSLGKAFEELWRAERAGVFNWGLPQRRARPVKGGRLPIVVQAVAAHALQPWRGNVGDVAIKKRLRCKAHQA